MCFELQFTSKRINLSFVFGTSSTATNKTTHLMHLCTHFLILNCSCFHLLKSCRSFGWFETFLGNHLECLAGGQPVILTLFPHDGSTSPLLLAQHIRNLISISEEDSHKHTHRATIAHFTVTFSVSERHTFFTASSISIQYLSSNFIPTLTSLQKNYNPGYFHFGS